MYWCVCLKDDTKPLTLVNPGTKPTFPGNAELPIPNAEFIVPAKVSLIMLNATNGGEYVIAAEANLAYLENIPLSPNIFNILSAPASPNPLNASANPGSFIS